MQGNSKNLILFLVLVFGLLLGWMELQRWLWPPPQKKPDEKPDIAKVDPKAKDAPKIKVPDKSFWGGLPAQGAPADPGLGGVYRLVTEVALANWSTGNQAQPRPTPEVAKPEKRRPHHPPITLGADTDNLKAVLDPEGACVRSVILNKFQQADRMGRPVWKEGNKKDPQPLELVTAELNRVTGSNLLLHFDPERKGNDPLPTLGQTEWDVKFEKVTEDQVEVIRRVEFSTKIDSVRITKTFSLEKQDYHIGLEVKLERLDGVGSDKVLPFRYQLTSAHGLRIEGDWYTSVLRNAAIGWRDTKKDTFLRAQEEARRVSFRLGGDPIEAREVKEGDRQFKDREIRWAGVLVQYFASLVVVDDRQENQGILARARSTIEGAAMKGAVKSAPEPGKRTFVLTSDKVDYTFHLGPLTLWPANLREGSRIAVVYTLDDYDHRVVSAFHPEDSIEPLFYNDIIARVTTEPVELKPGVPVVHKYLLYNGPVKVRLLGQLAGDKAVPQDLVDRYEDTLHLNTLTDYPSSSVTEWLNMFGWTWLLVKCTNLMHWILGLLHTIIWNWGLCIIALTVLVRGMMFPISRKQALTSLKMQELVPELKKLQEKHKNDRQAMGMAQMELYRKHGVNPLGTCWLLFLQMPVFLGLYFALQESIHFRLQPFGPWIENLAAPDMLFSWGESIPWISQPSDYGSFIYLGPYFNLLPVIAVALMIMQQSMMTPPAMDEQQAMQMKMMKYMMIVFGIMFYKVAAGLCIYFIASSAWGFAERKLLPKKKSAPGAAPSATSQGGLLSRLREKIESIRPAADSTTAVTAAPAASGQSTNGPAVAPSSEAIPSTVPPGQRKRGKRKRKGGGRPEGTPAGSGPATSQAAANPPNGVAGKMRSWWSGLREWWAEVLRKAEKK